MKIMITNGGPHPADRWADMTTETLLELIEVKEDSDTPEAAAARGAKRDLRPVLFNILLEHHGHVQTKERAKCKSAKHAGSRSFDPTEHLDGCADEVDAAFAATPFAEHFAKPEVRNIVHTIMAQHFVNSMNIERSYALDRTSKGA